MVRQLLTVTRTSPAPSARGKVVALGSRVRRAWEALGVDDIPFRLDDKAGGWLAIADGDQLDQVLWALLDNAVKYGGRRPVIATVDRDLDAGLVRLTIADGGPGIAADDRDRLFVRFARGSASAPDGGSSLGLYVSRELCRAMDGDLVLEPEVAGRGAAFTIDPARRPARRRPSVRPVDAAHRTFRLGVLHGCRQGRDGHNRSDRLATAKSTAEPIRCLTSAGAAPAASHSTTP